MDNGEMESLVNAVVQRLFVPIEASGRENGKT